MRRGAIDVSTIPDRPFTTPALVVDLDVFEANVAAMESILQGTGKTVRPHIKTHRTPELALRQLGGLAKGVACATVGEAEAMVDAGIDDVLIANEVVDPVKLARLASLARRASVMIAVDALKPLLALSAAAANVDVTVGVLVDVDTRVGRCGITTSEEAIALAAAAARAPGVRFRGLMGYEGRIRGSVPDRDRVIGRAYARLAGIRIALERSGYPVDIVSAAGSSTVREALAHPAITEVQAGTYALMEPDLEHLGLPFECAAFVRGMVISRHPGRVVLDAGRRVIGMEYGPPQPVGFAASQVAVNDEHTIVTMDDPPLLGSTLDLRPGQIRTTCNLHDRIWGMRGGQIRESWPVSARGHSW